MAMYNSSSYPDNNQYPSILKEIHLIAFPVLKELNITNNNVESV